MSPSPPPGGALRLAAPPPGSRGNLLGHPGPAGRLLSGQLSSVYLGSGTAESPEHSTASPGAPGSVSAQDRGPEEGIRVCHYLGLSSQGTCLRDFWGPFLTAARLKDHYSDHSLGTQFKGLWPWENLP